MCKFTVKLCFEEQRRYIDIERLTRLVFAVNIRASCDECADYLCAIIQHVGFVQYDA